MTVLGEFARLCVNKQARVLNVLLTFLITAVLREKCAVGESSNVGLLAVREEDQRRIRLILNVEWKLTPKLRGGTRLIIVALSLIVRTGIVLG